MLSLCVHTYAYIDTLYTNVYFSSTFYFLIYSCAPLNVGDMLQESKTYIYECLLIANNIHFPGNVDNYYFISCDLQIVLFQLEQSSGRLQSQVKCLRHTHVYQCCVLRCLTFRENCNVPDEGPSRTETWGEKKVWYKIIGIYITWKMVFFWWLFSTELQIPKICNTLRQKNVWSSEVCPIIINVGICCSYNIKLNK